MDELREKYDLKESEERRLEKNRSKSPYLRNMESDGVNYPIPELFDSTRIVLLDRDTVGAEELTFGYSEFAGKTSLHKKHTHGDCEEVMFILKGKGVGGVGEIECIFKEGDAIFVPEGTEHWFYNPYDEPCGMLFFYTKPSLREAGYALKSKGFDEQGNMVEKLQREGKNQFDRR